MISQNRPQQPVVALLAEDWAITPGPIDTNHAFELYAAWVIGFLLRETVDSITLAPELFTDEARRCQTIPKSAIRLRIDLGKLL